MNHVCNKYSQPWKLRIFALAENETFEKLSDVSWKQANKECACCKHKQKESTFSKHKNKESNLLQA
jgi:hypothetical protein